MNKTFLEKNGYLVKIKKILSAQFDIEGDAFQMYSVNEMLNLFDGFRLSDAEIKNRARAYLMMFNNNKIDYYEGETAEKMIKEFTDDQNLSKSELKGVIASKGKAVGKARIIEYNFNFEKSKKTIDAMKKDEILIAEVTSPEYMVACQKAAAIVTNQGGMLSHAAVVSREMDIPCVVGTGNATAVFKTGDMVEVDADNGVVRKI